MRDREVERERQTATRAHACTNTEHSQGVEAERNPSTQAIIISFVMRRGDGNIDFFRPNRSTPSRPHLEPPPRTLAHLRSCYQLPCLVVCRFQQRVNVVRLTSSHLELVLASQFQLVVSVDRYTKYTLKVLKRRVNKTSPFYCNFNFFSSLFFFFLFVRYDAAMTEKKVQLQQNLEIALRLLLLLFVRTVDMSFLNDIDERSCCPMKDGFEQKVPVDAGFEYLKDGFRGKGIL